MKKTSVSQSRPRKRKNPVKRFFVNLFVLFIFSGVIFYFGWVQFSLEEGEYGVFYSKTGGYEQETLQSGEFNWRWEKLIPTNATLHVVKPAKGTIAISHQGKLPSADLYADFIEEDKSVFGWNFSAEIFYSVDPASLPELVIQGYAGHPESWIETMEKSLTEEVNTYLKQETYITPLLQPVPDSKTLVDNLKQSFPYMETITFTLKELTYPDRELYLEAARLYSERLKRLKDTETEILSQQLRESADQSSKLDLLKQYGSILEEYPILLEFLTLEKADGQDPGIIDSLLPGIQ